MKIKQGVRLDGVHWKMFAAAIKIEAVLEKYGQECVITAGVDGKHMAKSRHYVGCALDFRNRDLQKADHNSVILDINAVLGYEYFTQMESNHIHCQWNGTVIDMI